MVFKYEAKVVRWEESSEWQSQECKEFKREQVLIAMSDAT